MLEIRRSTPLGLEQPSVPGPGCWLHVVAPTSADLEVVREFGVPAPLLMHVADLDERPRVEHAGELVLVVLHYPTPRKEQGGPPWRTLPLSVLLTPNGVVTIAPGPTPFLQPLLAGEIAAISTARAPEFLLRVFMQLAGACLDAVREINARVDTLEHELKRSLRNEEVLGLLEYQKSLTYFATGMKADELVLERLQRAPAQRWDASDQELSLIHI